jgi:TP901 family phage tail tape measure protein
MARIIEARAVISAEDKTGAVFDKIAKKIDGLAKSAKTSKAVDEMANAIERAKKQMIAIDKFDLSRGALPAARQKFREMQAAVEGAAKAMSSVSAPTKEMERNLKRAQDGVRKAAQAFDLQRDAVVSHKRALQDMGVNVSRAAAHQTRLRKSIEQTSAALDKHVDLEQRAHVLQQRRDNRRVAVGTAAAAAGAWAGHAVKSGTKATLHTYREFDKERRFGKAVMGLTDDEQAPLVNQAIHMGATTKFNDIQVLEAQRELAARGLKKDQIMGMMKPAGSLGMAMDLSLPESVKQMEGAIFGFKKDISTLPAAMASAQQTADYQVRAAKLSGMKPEDISQLYKFGATPARMAGVSEASLLGFGGVLKKANIGGDEAGVAFRALMSTIQSPTAGGKTALLANGLNYKNYQKTPDHLDVSPFADDVASRYGVKLDGKTRAGLGKIFADKDLLSDPAKFNPAVTGLLRETLGGTDAKSLKSISGAANRYRDSSVGKIDANAMIKDLLPKLANNLPLANKLFGAKQGGRIATALGDSDTLKHIIDEIENNSSGYAEKISAERMAGFDGAVSRFEGAGMNLKSAIGQSLDNNGKGGALTWVTDAIAKAIQGAAEMPKGVVAGGAITAGVAGAGASAYGAYKFMQLLTTGGGLTTSAVALDGAAAALTSAAAVLSGGKALEGAGAAAAARGGAGAVGVLGAMGTAGLLVGGVAASYWAMRNAPAMGGTTAGSRTRAGYIGGAPGIDYEGLTRRGGSRAGRVPSIWDGDRGTTQGYLNQLNQAPFSPGSGAGAGAITAQLNGSAEVKGEVSIKLTVEAGSELISVKQQADRAVKLAGSLNANGPGSTGRSSPDAAAPPWPSGGTSAWK